MAERAWNGMGEKPGANLGASLVQQAAGSEEQNVGSETASNPQPPRNRTFETF